MQWLVIIDYPFFNYFVQHFPPWTLRPQLVVILCLQIGKGCIIGCSCRFQDRIVKLDSLCKWFPQRASTSVPEFSWINNNSHEMNFVHSWDLDSVKKCPDWWFLQVNLQTLVSFSKGWKALQLIVNSTHLVWTFLSLRPRHFFTCFFYWYFIRSNH